MSGQLSNFQIPNFISESTGQNITSAAISFFNIRGLWSAQFSFTGDGIGFLKIQVSIDPDNIAPVSWSDLANAGVLLIAPDDVLFDVGFPFYNWARFVYSRTSGTGIINGRINIKENDSWRRLQ